MWSYEDSPNTRASRATWSSARVVNALLSCVACRLHAALTFGLPLPLLLFLLCSSLQGVPIRTLGMDQEKALQYAALVSDLTEISKKFVQGKVFESIVPDVQEV